MSEEELALWQDHRLRQNKAARGALVERYLWLARSTAHRIHKQGGFSADLELRELIQTATLALIEAVDRYDPTIGATFVAYAGKRLNGAVIDSIDHSSDLRAQLALVRDMRRERVSSISGSSEIADRLKRLVDTAVGVAISVLLEDTAMVADDSTVAVSGPYATGEVYLLQQHFKAIIAKLPVKERSVVQCHYYQDLSFAEIADLLDVSRARVSQLHAQAIQSIRQVYAGSGTLDKLI